MQIPPLNAPSVFGQREDEKSNCSRARSSDPWFCPNLVNTNRESANFVKEEGGTAVKRGNPDFYYVRLDVSLDGTSHQIQLSQGRAGRPTTPKASSVSSIFNDNEPPLNYIVGILLHAFNYPKIKYFNEALVNSREQGENSMLTLIKYHQHHFL